MRRLRIGIDMDGVLSDFEAGFRNACRELYGFPLKDIRPVDWNWSNFNLSGEQHGEIWMRIKDTPDFWRTLKPLGGTSMLVEASTVADLFFITSRCPTKGKPVNRQTALWLEENYGIEGATVLVSDDKGLLAAALKLHAFIDDKPANCLAVKFATEEMGRPCRTFMNAAHHNRYFQWDGVTVTTTLNYFLGEVLPVGAITPALQGV